MREVVKVGGSLLADGPRLRGVLARLATGGRCVVVPLSGSERRAAYPRRMGHDHAHGMSAGGRHRSRLLVVLGITVVVLVVEVVGSWLTGSLALLADAGHMLTDAAGITLAVLAVTFAPAVTVFMAAVIIVVVILHA